MTQALPTYCRWSGRKWSVTYDETSFLKPRIRIDAEGAGPSQLPKIYKAIQAAQRLQESVDEAREQQRKEAAARSAFDQTDGRSG